ncbi:hypothetical protein ABIE06_003384 [Pantoea dispersa]
MLSKTDFTHSVLLSWQNEYAVRSLNVNGTIMRDTYKPRNTAVRSSESNVMAESFVKTMKRDYISIMPKPDGLTTVKNCAEAFEYYNGWHPHSALGYRSPREYLRRRTIGWFNMDELQLGTERGTRKSTCSGEPMMPHSMAHFIYSLRRFMIDYENWGWGRLSFSLSRHLSTPETPLFRCGVNPQVIDAPVGLILVRASLSLRQEDLLT